MAALARLVYLHAVQLPNAAVALSALGLGALTALWWSHGSRARRDRRRFKRAAKAERDAITLATRAGYRVLRTQVEGKVRVEIDDELHEVKVRADMLLQRDGRRYIAEVKSGRVASDALSANTRRQLLEYAFAFEAQGVLFFDMERRRIQRVQFVADETPPRPSFGWLLAGALGIAVGWFLQVWLQ